MRAIALISGGLDSILAAGLIKDCGIEVIGLNFKIPFCRPQKKTNPKIHQLGIELKSIDISEEFLEIIKNPRYGFGSNMNPCIDCKILMLKKAKELMPKFGAKFIITGEVLGQRPMSQNRQALELIEKRAGLQGLLLRPLSAKLLSKTFPEKEGWINRDKLLDFNGRSRQPQIALAGKLRIKDYQQPAGGCLLTDPQFAKRVKDLLNHKELNLENIELLKIGRHFRLSQKTKLVVGRDERENADLLTKVKEGDYLFMPRDIAGPSALGKGGFSEDLINLSCRITCRYCDLNGKINADITYRRIPDKENKALKVSPLDAANLETFRI